MYNITKYTPQKSDFRFFIKYVYFGKNMKGFEKAPKIVHLYISCFMIVYRHKQKKCQIPSLNGTFFQVIFSVFKFSTTSFIHFLNLFASKIPCLYVKFKVILS